MKTIDDEKNKNLKAGDDEPVPGESSTAPPGEEDLVTKDTSKFTEEQKNDYIEKLKDENARRRIENKKIKDQLSQQMSATEKLNKEFEELSEKVKAYESKEREKTEAEKSEIEKLKSQMDSIQKEISERDQKISTLESELSKKELRLEEASRERMVDRLCSQLGITFTSDYERKGLMLELLNREGNTFSLNDDEVIYKLQTLSKERKKTPPTQTPGAGPQTRTTGTPLVERIKTLTSKENLTFEDRQELDSLLAEAEKARTGG